VGLVDVKNGVQGFKTSTTDGASMLAYSTYSEAGGVGKTTTAANLAVAHARAGLKPLVVPLDPQDGDLSRLFGVDKDRTESVDNLVRHMVRRPTGEFDDLVQTVEGIDIIPEHNMLSDLAEYLQREKEQSEAMGEAFGMHTQLLRVLREAGVPDTYDVLICDPPATEGPHLYNAIHATRSLVIPVEPSAKGRAAVQGLESLVQGLEDQLDVNVGVLGAVPVGFKNTRDQRQILDEISYPIPEVIGERASLMEGCWMQQCSAYEYIRTHRTRQRDYELETLAKFDRIARHLEAEVGIDAPNPPEPGDLDHEVISA
jgi:cellulose biosynthesis protein BcsQ